MAKKKKLKRKKSIRRTKKRFDNKFIKPPKTKIKFSPKIITDLYASKPSKVSIGFGATVLCIDGKAKGLKGYVIAKTKSDFAKVDVYTIFFPEVKEGLMYCERQQIRRIKFIFL